MTKRLLRSSGASESELRELLNRAGSDAFDELCSRGCDAETLAGVFLWVRALAKGKAEAAEMSDGSSVMISFAMLDHRNTAIGDYDLRGLKRIAKQAMDLKEEIKRLSRTYVVQQLISTGEIGHEDLLASGLHLDSRFRGLEHLPKLLRACGPRQSPDFNNALMNLIGHVKCQLRKPHYALLVIILNALSLEYTEESLKQFYFRRCRTLSKNSKSSQTSKNR